MEKKYVLAIDQSTQGTKAMLFDKAQKILHREDISHRQLVDDKGHVSHDLNEIYDNIINAVKRLVDNSGIDKNEIACVGISNQRETSAAWSRRSGSPLADAVVWQCRRAKDICDRIIKNQDSNADGNYTGAAELIRQRTGIQLSPYFPAAKFAWLFENEEAVQRARNEHDLCIGTIDTYLLYRLTGGKTYATDYSNASRTQLFDIHALKWDEQLCGIFGIDMSLLPKVCESSCAYGETDFEGVFDSPLPICAVVGDSQGALFGQGCLSMGMVKATYGTGSSVMMNAGSELVTAPSGLVASIAWGINGKISYVMEGNINYTGAVISWLKDEVGIIDSPLVTSELADAANPNDTTYLVPAFSGLGAPYWSDSARAMLCGMCRTTGKNEIVKASLESIAYQIADVVNIMKEYLRKEGAQEPLKELCAGGGATGNRYLMQFQSDILDTEVLVPECEEASALGAALMAGLYTGFYNVEDVKDKKCKCRYKSSMSEINRRQKYDGWKAAVGLALQENPYS